MSWKMGFQWRRNAKGPLPSSLLFFPRRCRHYLFTPRDDDDAWCRSSSHSNRSGGNSSPDQQANHAAFARARQSLAIIQTSLGHSASRSLHTTTTLHFVRFLSGGEFVRLFVGILNSAAVRPSVLQHFRESNCVCGGPPIRIASRRQDGLDGTRTYALRISEIRASLGNSARSTTRRRVTR